MTVLKRNCYIFLSIFGQRTLLFIKSNTVQVNRSRSSKYQVSSFPMMKDSYSPKKQSTQHNTQQHNTTTQHNNTTQHNTTQHTTTQHNTTQHTTTQHNTTTQQHNNTTQHNTTQHNTTQHNYKKSRAILVKLESSNSSGRTCMILASGHIRTTRSR